MQAAALAYFLGKHKFDYLVILYLCKNEAILAKA